MAVTLFPDPKTAGPDGLVAWGGDLKPETLLSAYRQGIFPWPMPGYPLTWFSPQERAILDFGELHIPRSLAKSKRKLSFRFTVDQAFQDVITACARVPRPERGTWITTPMIRAYCELHALGYAHSVEAWLGDGLVGGIYGVEVDGTFAGESMFHRKSDASKLALLYLIEHLKSRGLDWIDIQVMTPHLKSLGARKIGRDEFMERLQRTQARGLKLFDPFSS